MRTNTMPTIGFDTLKFVKALVNSGMPTPQAEALAKEQSELLSYQFDQLATKSDIRQVQAEIKHLAENTQVDIKHLEDKIDANLEIRLARLQLQLMLAFFGGLTTAVGIVLGAIKLML